MAVISLDIAAMHAKSFIEQRMLENVPNYVTKFYLGSPFIEYASSLLHFKFAAVK